MEISIHIIIISILMPNSNNIVASSVIPLLSLFLYVKTCNCTEHFTINMIKSRIYIYIIGVSNSQIITELCKFLLT